MITVHQYDEQVAEAKTITAATEKVLNLVKVLIESSGGGSLGTRTAVPSERDTRGKVLAEPSSVLRLKEELIKVGHRWVRKEVPRPVNREVVFRLCEDGRKLLSTRYTWSAMQ